MAELIACLSTGKGTWGHVARLMQDQEWTKIYLITNDYGKENFNSNDKTELINVNMGQGLIELRDEIKEKLGKRIQESEVAVNFVSGTGKEHMALMSALLKLGIGIRFLALTKDGVEEV
ncbi:hypothetical protein CL617_04595 [archaeon]|nr:hypothetical protein [archaeon]|tara:strand:+ start:7579 stop:7935 length:357 start_codon:yes stop_codon:yes gene_type:complete